MQPVIDIYTKRRCPSRTHTREVEEIIGGTKDKPGVSFILRGQSETMKKSYIGLLTGLAFSILLVYLLIVVNPIVA